MKITSAPQLNGNERIMLVDDEQAILSMVYQTLSRFGYQVSSYNLSTEALTCFENTPDAFDLIITDMTMPGLSGEMFISKTKRIRPEIPIILCTGYSEEVLPDQSCDAKPDKILMKPAGKDDLLKSIRFLLDD